MDSRARGDIVTSTAADVVAGAEATGRFVTDGGDDWYQIVDYDLLDPFFITVVSPDDHWLYVSTSGALTAGRGSADRSLFPYETDDRLHRSGGRVGPVTIIRADDGAAVWRPFAVDVPIGSVRRTLFKSTFGDRLRFSEHHPGLGMTFSYTWVAAGRFGIVRSCELSLDAGRTPTEVDVLDGMVDILPSGVDIETQRGASTLVDAYRRSELIGPSGLALYTLEALVSDQADPAESLRANVIWTHDFGDGLGDATTVMSDRDVRRFLSETDLSPEELVTGRKGAYLRSSAVTVRPDRTLRWATVADVDYHHGAVNDLVAWLGATEPAQRWAEVEHAIDQSRDRLDAIVAQADGHQVTADRRATVHHLANVMFNVMRGGVFVDSHQVEVAAVTRSIEGRNQGLMKRFVAATVDLPPTVDIAELRSAVKHDVDLLRLVNEYLPLTFSRRHGDPSRPWNKFNIAPRAADGSTAIGYEGNWRDIFQNWEALLNSYPGYIESVASKFLSASTLDGHNPYRITDRGIDWEVPEDGSWGNFGYWGDHQIVYLHRLLSVAERFQPGLLESKLGLASYSYADIPYRIRPYADLVRDPKNTIDFDTTHQEQIAARESVMGSDGRLVPAPNGEPGEVHLGTLAEKLMIPAMAKLSNLVAGAGIWMNTQRPEWNDANNALVGNGVSVVTLFHLRDYVLFIDDLLSRATVSEVAVDGAVADWIDDVERALVDHVAMAELDRAITPAERRSMLDQLGEAFSRYRARVYEHGPAGPAEISVDRLRSLLAAAKPHLQRAVAAAGERSDGLVETYSLLRLEPGAAHVEPLYEMLEGQVASLAGGHTEATETLGRLDALFSSDVYRADQQSFVLYPNRKLPSFVEKNIVNGELLTDPIRRLMGTDAGSSILRVDGAGQVHFDASLVSPRELRARLRALAGVDEVGSLIAEAEDDLIAAYEAVFNHRAFTGRSQSMYRYEGLGSIYWHMVSKLLLAVQEQVMSLSAVDQNHEAIPALAAYYQRIRGGLGFMKSVAEQGSFPTDPHSHTPSHTGAQQPGMTGQVKEGVLIRWGELGIEVDDGCVSFRPILLSSDEFLGEPTPWPALGSDGSLPEGTLGFTYCSVPLVYHLGDGEWVEVSYSGGRTSERLPTAGLDSETSRVLFARRGEIDRIDVGVDRSRLLG